MRVEGRLLPNGDYEVRQGDLVLRVIPAAEAANLVKLGIAIKRNGWEKVE